MRKIGKTLQDQHGAPTEYQRLLQNLQALQFIFQHLDRLDDSESNRRYLDSIKAEATRSLEPLNEFLMSIAKYEKRLGTAPQGRRLFGRTRKAQWAVTVANEISKLQSSISKEVDKMNLLMSVEQLYVFFPSVLAAYDSNETYSGALARIEARLATQALRSSRSSVVSRTIHASGSTLRLDDDYGDSEGENENENPSTAADGDVAQSTSSAIAIAHTPSYTERISGDFEDTMSTQDVRRADILTMTLELNTSVQGLLYVAQSSVAPHVETTPNSVTFLGLSLAKLPVMDLRWTRDQARIL